MSKLHQPACVGALIVGISFNVVLGLLGVMGMSLTDALYLTVMILTMSGSAVVQVLLHRSGKDRE